MEKEFEDFFQYINTFTNSDQVEMRNLLTPLKNHLWRQQLKKVVKFALIFATICCTIYYIDTLNWYFCGVCRTVMIQILPIWNWTYLANSKCLIAKAAETMKSNHILKATTKDCRACEHFGKIDVLEITSYAFINSKFLVRGLPVIISDAALDYNRSETLSQFIDNITVNMSGIVQQEACSLETNLMISSFASVGESFGILSKISGNADEPWFISFRNCNLKALKSSRIIMSKPYFYPRNLQAPSSSWLLMSQNYSNYKNELNLYGLIIVTQLRGSLKVILRPKDICMDMCNDVSMKLFSGEALIFVSELWIFSYEYLSGNDFTLTFITETDFN